jgi:hypothetical protein
MRQNIQGAGDVQQARYILSQFPQVKELCISFDDLTLQLKILEGIANTFEKLTIPDRWPKVSDCELVQDPLPFLKSLKAIVPRGEEDYLRKLPQSTIDVFKKIDHLETMPCVLISFLKRCPDHALKTIDLIMDREEQTKIFIDQIFYPSSFARLSPSEQEKVSVNKIWSYKKFQEVGWKWTLQGSGLMGAWELFEDRRLGSQGEVIWNALDNVHTLEIWQMTRDDFGYKFDGRCKEGAMRIQNVIAHMLQAAVKGDTLRFLKHINLRQFYTKEDQGLNTLAELMNQKAPMREMRMLQLKAAQDPKQKLSSVFRCDILYQMLEVCHEADETPSKKVAGGGRDPLKNDQPL